MKKEKGFLHGAALLGASVILAKILGAVYRIPLTNILGAEGMGIYHFVYPVFALILTLSSGAVPTAISITVSKSAATLGPEQVKTDFGIALKICFLAGALGTAAMLAVAYPLCLIQSTDALLGYAVVAPAILVVTVISAFRGYFMGLKNMLPTSISQITEGIVKLGIGITLAKLLLRYGLRYSVAGALIGVASSEIVTLIILAAIYFKKEGKIPKARIKDNKAVVKNLGRLAFPLILCGAVLPLSQFIDSVLLVNLMRWGGTSGGAATTAYGVYTGTVSPLINLPVMVCITLGIAITPQMVDGKIKRDVDFIMEKASTATKIIFVMCVPFILIFIFMSEGIVSLLFPAIGAENIALGAKLLSISSISVLALSIFQIYSAMLQGLEKTYAPLKIMAFFVVLKTLASVVLVPLWGMTGAAVCATAAFVGAGISVMAYFFKYIRPTDDLIKNASLITLCGVIMSMIIVFTIKLQKNALTMILIGAAGFIIYALSLFALRVFSRAELESLPFSKALLKLDSVFHRKKRV